jgi:Forkhead domain
VGPLISLSAPLSPKAMSSLLNILNPHARPESPSRYPYLHLLLFYTPLVHYPLFFSSSTDMEKLPHSASPSSSTSPRSNRTIVDGPHYSRDGPPSGEHEMHPDCPDTLDCLPDTDGRPQHTLPVILRCAILGSPRKRLTIREIYATMEEKYPYYKTAGPTWKVSLI